MRNGIVIDAADNVAVLIEEHRAGERLALALPDGTSEAVEAQGDIPLFHKVARRDIPCGERVVKYSEYIGVATRDIRRGEHVHVRNCASTDADRAAALAASQAERHEGNTEGGETPHAHRALNPAGRTFMGYRRADGRVGIRNHVLVLPTSICASDTAERIARAVAGCVSFHNQSGCSQVDADRDLTLRTLAGLADNPNVYGVLCLSLGCEGCQNDMVASAIAKRSDKPVRTLVIQEEGGTLRAIERGIRLACELAAEAAREPRAETPISELILGTNCGGSDTSSGLGANPLIGHVSDWMVEQGATSVLCETPELFGAEDVLIRRAKDAHVGAHIREIVDGYERYVRMFGAQMREGNPSPGNIAGGLTTLEEKSLGCIHKGGRSAVNAVYGYAEQLKRHEGLVVMDTPGNDPASIGGIVAGGCQLVLFSTGRGTPTGNAVAPVLRLTANPETWARMRDNTDFDASAAIFGPETMEELRDALIEQIVAVCNGQQTRAEALGFIETALPHLCNYM